METWIFALPVDSIYGRGSLNMSLHENKNKNKNKTKTKGKTKQTKTRWREDMNFMFGWQEQYANE